MPHPLHFPVNLVKELPYTRRYHIMPLSDSRKADVSVQDLRASVAQH